MFGPTVCVHVCVCVTKGVLGLYPYVFCHHVFILALNGSLFVLFAVCSGTWVVRNNSLSFLCCLKIVRGMEWMLTNFHRTNQDGCMILE